MAGSRVALAFTHFVACADIGHYVGRHPRKTTIKAKARTPDPKVVNLLTDLKEQGDVAAKYSWVIDPAVRIVGELEASLKNIRRSRSERRTRMYCRNRQPIRVGLQAFTRIEEVAKVNSMAASRAALLRSLTVG